MGMEVGEAEEGRLGAGGDEFEEVGGLLRGELLLHHLPQPPDDPVRPVEPAVVHHVTPWGCMIG